MWLSLRMIRILGFCLLIYVQGCLAPKHRYEEDKIRKSVIRIIDGDTFVVVDGSEKGETVRLIGVDAPETRRSSNKDIGHFGEEAKLFLSNLLQEGQVELLYDVGKKDRYGRTLAYVYLPDGTFINAEMVKQGYATVMTVPPNVTYAERFLEFEQQAKRRKRGLWK